MIAVIAAMALVWIVAGLALGHIAHPTRTRATRPGTAAEDLAAVEEHDMPERPANFPALAVACPPLPLTRRPVVHQPWRDPDPA